MSEKIASDENSSKEEEKKLSEKLAIPIQSIADEGISLYRFRKDVCFKFILRKFKSYYKEDFLFVTGYERSKKDIKERHTSLKQCWIDYWRIKGYLEISPEFPFYLWALIFSKDAQEIVKKLDIDTDKKSKVLKVVNLFSTLVKNYSELKLRKICMIDEIRIILQNFINLANSDQISLSGLVESNSELDERYIKTVLIKFDKLIERFTGKSI